MGRGDDQGGVGLNALRGLRPEHPHRVAFPLPRPRGADLLAQGEEVDGVHSQLLYCSASEVAAMVEGAMHHDTTMNVEGNYTDSHGQSENRVRHHPPAGL